MPVNNKLPLGGAAIAYSVEGIRRDSSGCGYVLGSTRISSCDAINCSPYYSSVICTHATPSTRAAGDELPRNLRRSPLGQILTFTNTWLSLFLRSCPRYLLSPLISC
jgi:hypothetical protein